MPVKFNPQGKLLTEYYLICNNIYCNTVSHDACNKFFYIICLSLEISLILQLYFSKMNSGFDECV